MAPVNASYLLKYNKEFYPLTGFFFPGNQWIDEKYIVDEINDSLLGVYDSLSVPHMIYTSDNYTFKIKFKHLDDPNYSHITNISAIDIPEYLDTPLGNSNSSSDVKLLSPITKALYPISTRKSFKLLFR